MCVLGHTMYKDVICDISNIKGELTCTGEEFLYAIEIKLV